MARFFLVVTLLLGFVGFGPASAGAQTPAGGGIAVRGPEFGGRVEVAQRGPAERPRPNRLWRLPDRRGPSREPAAARGYSDGYRRGLNDGRDRDRYDPVGHGDYRSADPGYYRDYGSRDAYRNNYRAGFRQGYEDGYRDGARGRR